jgi:hypothetical protein
MAESLLVWGQDILEKERYGGAISVSPFRGKSGSEPDFARPAPRKALSPGFAGTRVPVQTLLDCLEGGESIDDFLEGFPSVKREQIVAFLEEARASLLAQTA